MRDDVYKLFQLPKCSSYVRNAFVISLFDDLDICFFVHRVVQSLWAVENMKVWHCSRANTSLSYTECARVFSGVLSIWRACWSLKSSCAEIYFARFLSKRPETAVVYSSICMYWGPSYSITLCASIVAQIQLSLYVLEIWKTNTCPSRHVMTKQPLVPWTIRPKV